jgi:PKHD-type hydroxylase
MSYQGKPGPIMTGNFLKPQGQRFLHSQTRHFFKQEDLPRLKALIGPLEPGRVVRSPDYYDNREETPVPGLAEHPELRQSQVFFIEPSEESKWLYELLTDVIGYHNERFYNFNLTGIETMQFSEYPEGAGFYAPHQDWGAGLVQGRSDICRKLSFTVQLSNPDSYEGGDLNIHCGDINPLDPSLLREFGSITVFPSFMVHEVTPVTRGTRRSLVGWVVGPDFI